jgi:hypothetical protein
MLTICLTQGGTIYVTTSGNDASSGTSWAQAMRSITNAMVVAAAGDQIWVASGTYTQLVTMKAGVALYGGFNGTETALAQRNFGTNICVLDGHSQGTVITINQGGLDTRVDGMVLTGGSGINGGGISIVAAAPSIMNNFISHNTVNGGTGAGIFISGYLVVSNAQPVIFNNTIYQNLSIGANGDGGGIAMGGSSPLVGYNRVLGNVAGRYAGGIGCWKDCHAVIVNNTIEGNATGLEVSVGTGGGVFATANDFDGTFVQDAISAPLIIDNVIAANGATSGGGLAFADSNTGTASVLNNTIIANTGSGIYWADAFPSNCNNLIAYNSGGLERFDTSAATLRNNNVYGNNVLGAKTDYIGVPDATGVNGNISAEPKLVNYQIGNFHQQPNSPCVDAGLASAVVPGYPDADLNPRVVGAAVDIGAYESTGVTFNVPTPIIHVSTTGNDSNDGLTWATARKTVQGGVRAAAPFITLGGEVWVAQGTYSEHIALPAFVYLYGGFAGSETTRSARNIAAHPTIVDGGGQPTVVLSQGAGYLVSALDGFTVQDGGVYTAGNFTGGPDGRGGGINCTVSSPFIANNLIQSNSVGTPFNSTGNAQGGGIYLYVAHAQITGNTFRNNDVVDSTAGTGGAIYATLSKPTIARNTFSVNHARYGPAITANISSPVITGNTFLTNSYYNSLPSFPTYGGANDGAVYLTGCNNFVVNANRFQGNWAAFGAGLDLKVCETGQVENNLFFANLAVEPSSGIGWGGGIYCSIVGQDIPGNILMLNNTIVSNSAPGPFNSDQGGGISLSLATNTLVLANNIIAFNSGGVYGSASQPAPVFFGNNCVTNPVNYTGVNPGTGDIHLDPKFTNAAAGDFHLLSSSPCIDSGTALYAAGTDFDGVARPLDGNNDGTAAFDIGAFEFVHPTADTDHDGMPDLSEIIAGTNPTDPTSYLKLLSHAAAGGSIALDWLSVTGRTYTVEFRSTVTGNWQTLSNNIPGTGTALEILDPTGSGATRFYRLGVTRN